MVLDILLDAFLDTLKVIPFLLGVYILIEYIEHKSSDKLGNALKKMGPFGSIGGAILGVIPQCGFSVVASNLFAGRLITMGTLLAVFISTSDEAIPMLVSNPGSIGDLWKFILIKMAVAIAVGIVVDLILRLLHLDKQQGSIRDLCSHCDCEHHSIFRAALSHTVEIIIFIFIVNLLLNGFMEFAGKETVSKILMTDSVFQPLIAAVVGFIPNCAASVVLTQLYISGVLSFGSIIAGLTTSAGIGILVLFKINKHQKQNLSIMAILYIVGVASGLIINAIV
ncbi:MAG: arsenic efflux protein [Ruminococcus sp.]|nr:arsenic efflux protein [Ruminococcus sp.]